MTIQSVSDDVKISDGLKKYINDNEGYLNYLKNYMNNEDIDVFKGHLIASAIDTLTTLNRLYYPECTENDELMTKIFEMMYKLK